MLHRPTFRLVAFAALLSAVAGSPATIAHGATIAPLTTVSGPSPYASCVAGGISGTPPQNVNYVHAEVEPYVAVNPKTVGTKQVNIIGVWQQDRWSTGSANGLVAGYSLDGGKTWGTTPLPFNSCAPGGADFERASDPWVSIGPDGTAYAVAL